MFVTLGDLSPGVKKVKQMQTFCKIKLIKEYKIKQYQMNKGGVDDVVKCVISSFSVAMP